jgi:hypothetical protein
MDAQQVMINKSFNQVERTEANQHRAGQKLARPAKVPPPRGAPQDDQAQNDKDIRAGVKDAVQQCIEFEIFNAVGRIARARYHVMPLQDLVQHDPIEESAEAKAE